MPGHFYQGNALYHALNGVNSDIRGKTGMYPLLTQPIMEIVLSIPTYELYDKGFDRYIFREAIHQFFNTEYVWRKDNGEVSGVYQLAYKEYQDYITEAMPGRLFCLSSDD